MKSKKSVPWRELIPPMRGMLVAAAILVFIVGISLNLLTEQTDRFFAWTIATPMTAAFLGAAYWSAGILELLAAREKWWVRARIAVPTVVVFTALTLIVTLVHIDKFHLASPDPITRFGTWFWVLVYGVVPIVMGIFWVAQVRAPGMDPPRKYPPPPWMRVVLAMQAAILLVVGALLLLVPDTVAPYWLWALTPLTGRAIGAWLFAVGVAAAQSIWENDLERVRIASICYAVIGVFELVALARFASDVNWASPSAWVYVIFLLSLLGVGIASWLAARRLPDSVRNSAVSP